MRGNVLGFPVDVLTSEQALERVHEACSNARPLIVVTLNAEMSMQGLRDPGLGQVLREAGLVLPDGSGVVWALRSRGIRVTKLAGVDFLVETAAWAAREGKRVYLLGGAPGIADKAAEELLRRSPGLQIAGVRDGFFQPEQQDEVVAGIRESGADVLWVALGVPRQEKWLHAHLAASGAHVGVGVGGSFDVLAGKVNRAPMVFQKLHLEWLYRLIQEPWRWQRMCSTLPQFAWRVLSEKGGAR
ncbi:MAG: WecB/TagA/CpsF family glycosyltransferase [bacterium]|nr:WecB/TagA/CpsF family glycosyltransferase [bacterium]